MLRATSMLHPRWQNIALVLLGVMTLSYFLHSVYGRDLIHVHIGRGCRRVGILTGIFIGLGVFIGAWSILTWLRARKQTSWKTTIGIVRSVQTSTTVRSYNSSGFVSRCTVCARHHLLPHGARSYLCVRWGEEVHRRQAQPGRHAAVQRYTAHLVHRSPSRTHARTVGERISVRFDPVTFEAVLADEDSGQTAVLGLKVTCALLLTAAMWYWQSGVGNC